MTTQEQLPADGVLNTPPMMGPLPGMPLPPGMSPPGMPPTVEALATATEKATSSEPPTMADAPDALVDLPAGWITPGGLLVRQAEVRELTGYDEERLARVNIDKNVGLYVTELLLLGMVSLGGEKPTRDIVRNLLIGDRDALVLGISRATYGNTVELQLSCTACENKSEVEIELDTDIENIPMEDPLKREFEIDLRHCTAKMALLTGVAQEAISENLGTKTQAEIETVMLSKSVIEIDGVPVRGKSDPVRALPAADRKTLTDFMSKKQPGPQITSPITVKCATCGEEYPYTLGLNNLFRF